MKVMLEVVISLGPMGHICSVEAIYACPLTHRCQRKNSCCVGNTLEHCISSDLSLV